MPRSGFAWSGRGLRVRLSGRPRNTGVLGFPPAVCWSQTSFELPVASVSSGAGVHRNTSALADRLFS